MMRTTVAISPIAGMVLAGCMTSSQDVDGARLAAPDGATYDGVETRLLDGDLVNFLVEMRGARGPDDVTAYAECAAAQYALIRGFGFARQVRTTVDENNGRWTGDAVYTISPTLPRGTRTIDAEVVTAACNENGIPTV
jgi:hypothetical protein